MPGEFDVATIVFNRFKSAMTQITTEQQLIPRRRRPKPHGRTMGGAVYEFEPDEATSWPTCCRRHSRSRSIARCWKARPVSMAHG